MQKYYKCKIEDYKRYIKDEGLDINEEKNLLQNEFADTFNLVSSNFRTINSCLLANEYVMIKEIFDALYELKTEIEYLNFLCKKHRQKSFDFNIKAVDKLNKHVAQCRNNFHLLLDSLPAPDNPLNTFQVDKIIRCHKELYYSLGFDIDNHEEILFLRNE